LAIIIALDFPSGNSALTFLSHWKDQPKPWIKIGYQLFYATGPKWVLERKEEGYPIFLDLKLHDIPNTIAKAVESLSSLGVDMLTVHASGGSAMMEAAREAAEKRRHADQRMKILAVTQLTSTDQQMLNEELGIPGSVADHVVRLAQLSYRSGADGVICSGQEIQQIKAATAREFLAVVPGIRPVGTDHQDQKRVVTPQKAIEAGADYLVIGRPITQAKDPLQAYEQIRSKIEER
jgi:orotidine-5'-phosphate decarboxylase